MSTIPRKFKMKGVVRSPRSSVTPADHPALDSLLKDLRTCHRRLTNATKAQHEELRILERLYYKSNNQHRSSMLWKKMVEMRRIGGRLIEVNLPGVVETLRRGFYSEDVISATSGNKALKGPWTHVPDLQYLSQIAKRAEQIHLLLRKAEDVYLKCYDAFALSLQDTSFIVLSVTLMAITARLNHLVQECREALYSLSAAISGLKGILYPVTPKAQLTLENVELVESARKKSDGMDYESDLGTVVERATFHEAPTMPALAVSGLDDLMTFDDDMVQDLQSVGVTQPSLAPSKSADGTVNDFGANQKLGATPLHSFFAATDDGMPKRKANAVLIGKKKKKKAKDEIDDIFG